MTDINHRRKNKKPVNQRYKKYHNGYNYENNKMCVEDIKKQKEDLDLQGMNHIKNINEGASGAPRISRTDYLDKSMHGWGRKGNISDKSIFAVIGNDFSNGHRGMAKAVKGAKKFVRSRIRFHENNKTKKLLLEIEN